MKSKSLVPTRENQVAIRYSDAELELVLEGAVLDGVNRSEFIREASKKEARRLARARQKAETSEIFTKESRFGVNTSAEGSHFGVNTSDHTSGCNPHSSVGRVNTSRSEEESPEVITPHPFEAISVNPQQGEGEA